jgi:hypothetical protein
MVRRRGVWPVIRRIWIKTGITATVVFVTWSLWAYRASSAAHAAMVSDEQVDVLRVAHHWTFLPRAAVLPVGLLFFPGALVDPVAYAPLLRRVAEAGYPVVLVQVPRRGAFGGAEGAEPLNRGVTAMASVAPASRWVVACLPARGTCASTAATTRSSATTASNRATGRQPSAAPNSSG